ncbi:hypothetical protein [Nostocoides sp. Soil756]|uniref:hypothetical protein n=1 Tax=Nostocoides sp. Soil756 TaxID=1736399 RepID=UPI0006F27529|nr:hypothetical protein [Tetrasphaera sp. Soil756]KRE61649.1 hypothetical protein ASG78_09895 [Tetrasphaera sp. Soil756]
MGLFDQFRAHPGAYGLSMDQPPLRPTAPVPHLDDLEAPFEEWIRDHLARLTDAAESDLDALDQDEFDAALTVRLAGSARLRETGLGFEYALPFADGVDEVLSLDLPDAVVTLPDERVSVLGRYVPDLVDLGRRNLRRLLAVTPVDVDHLSAGGSSCVLVQSDSPYTASFARLLFEAVPWWMPDADTSNGVVFAMPHRHAVVFQTCSSPAETKTALDLVPWHASQLYGEGVGPVSPHTYHWLDRRVTTLTHETSDGSLTVRPTPFLESLLANVRRVG